MWWPDRNGYQRLEWCVLVTISELTSKTHRPETEIRGGDRARQQCIDQLFHVVEQHSRLGIDREGLLIVPFVDAPNSVVCTGHLERRTEDEYSTVLRR